MRKTLGDVFRDLSYGHLSNLSIGGDGKGSIPQTHQERILALVNQGVTKLSSRFVVREKILYLRTTKDKLEYSLVPAHADNDPTVGEKYITDTVENPFTDEISNILIIMDENNDELIINNREVSGSVMIRNETELKFAEIDKDATFEVVYQPYPVMMESVDPAQVIRIPDVLYEALEAYVGYRVYGAMNGPEHKMRADDLKMSYEMICNDALEKGLVKLSVIGGNSKLEFRGFA